MSKRLILLLAVALAVGLCSGAYAAVQNVKVSGDILLQGVARTNFDLASGSAGDKENDRARFLLSTVRLRVDADLTDNVSATVRLLNERIWGKDAAAGSSKTDIDVDLAYITLKEFLYSPMTLTVGRQNLRFGNALIVGDVDTNRSVSADSALFGAANFAADLSARKSFDAIRATLDYDPLVIDLIYAKVTEGTVTRNDDENLYGINAHYDLGVNNATADLYFFAKTDSGVTDASKGDKVYNIGGLLAGEIIDRLTGSLEYAYQFGRIKNDTVQGDASRRAWALQTGLNYALDMEMSPNVGVVYTFLSGDKKTDNKYRYWDPMYEDQVLNAIPNALFPASNCHVINIKGSLKPMDDVTLSAVYGYYRLAQNMDIASSVLPGTYNDYAMTSKKDLGNALDLTAIYDYTEDVQLGLTLGWFDPGKAFTSANRRDATQVIGSMKVTF